MGGGWFVLLYICGKYDATNIIQERDQFLFSYVSYSFSEIKITQIIFFILNIN